MAKLNDLRKTYIHKTQFRSFLFSKYSANTKHEEKFAEWEKKGKIENNKN